MNFEMQKMNHVDFTQSQMVTFMHAYVLAFLLLISVLMICGGSQGTKTRLNFNLSCKLVFSFSV